MEKDKKTRDLKLESFLARESARRKRAAALNESPDSVDEALERLVEEERIRRDTDEDTPKKR
ncbi:hypothetical protein AUC68_07640 [Methyloceanibacter methanicus]|uniref:Uncharacterized protein n=1 Tax=Methyloceanibacter methanicus TaxID=1774968 RepID=A0A1E3VZQ7_9HYPH|nr:hypothetical protein [Methyloceanibacter methanicus]ODR99012.1 hypothetical protein AUC68_07640 [Methyloceanibacter methanicus]